MRKVTAQRTTRTSYALDDLYKEESKVGTPISPELAGVLNRALQAIPDGTEKEVDKIRQLRGKYIRQDNMDSLQVPRIDSFLWRQLKRDTVTRFNISTRCVCETLMPPNGNI